MSDFDADFGVQLSDTGRDRNGHATLNGPKKYFCSLLVVKKYFYWASCYFPSYGPRTGVFRIECMKGDTLHHTLGASCTVCVSYIWCQVTTLGCSDRHSQTPWCVNNVDITIKMHSHQKV